MTPDREQLEFAISQYIDGTLPELERAAFERRFADDAETRALLDEYRSLDALMKHVPPMPAIAWDRLANQIQQSLAEHEIPVQHIRLTQSAWPMRMAIAAVLLLVIGITYRFIPRQVTVTPVAGTIAVSGPTVEQAAGSIVEEISIHPAPSLASGSRSDDEIISRPSVVIIDRAGSSAQDGDENNMY